MNPQEHQDFVVSRVLICPATFKEDSAADQLLYPLCSRRCAIDGTRSTLAAPAARNTWRNAEGLAWGDMDHAPLARTWAFSESVGPKNQEHFWLTDYFGNCLSLCSSSLGVHKRLLVQKGWETGDGTLSCFTLSDQGVTTFSSEARRCFSLFSIGSASACRLEVFCASASASSGPQTSQLRRRGVKPLTTSAAGVKALACSPNGELERGVLLQCGYVGLTMLWQVYGILVLLALTDHRGAWVPCKKLQSYMQGFGSMKSQSC